MPPPCARKLRHKIATDESHQTLKSARAQIAPQKKRGERQVKRVKATTTTTAQIAQGSTVT